jgi:predicted lipoprotein with Yx(FWY)xxD motif
LYANAGEVHDACVFPGASYLFSVGNLGDGMSAAFTSNGGNRLNLTATVVLNSPPGGPAQHTLSVSPAGSGYGTVQSSPAGIEACSYTCSHAFDDGTVVTLTASPDSYSSFGGWSGGGCSGMGQCQVTIGSDTAVTATFSAGGGSYNYSYNYPSAGGGATGTGGSGGTTHVKCKTRRRAAKKAGCAKSRLVAKAARSANLGKRILTAANGHTLYTLSGESGNAFLCTGGCLSVWPPLKVPAGVRPLGPVRLGTVKRTEGGFLQVTYHGHPLYTFSGDSRPGDTHGQGLQTADGTWGAVVLPAVQK